MIHSMTAIAFIVLLIPYSEAAQISPDRTTELSRLFFEARKLTPEQVAEIEKRTEERPDSLEDRIQLIGYYQPFEPTHVQPRRRHVLWVMKNHPALPTQLMSLAQLRSSRDTGHVQARQIWLEHTRTQPNDPVVMRNAAQYFVLQDKALAERFFRQGETLTPSDYFWGQSLGHLYMLQAKGAARVEFATKAVDAYERAIELAPSREYVLDNLAEAAYGAELFDKAEQYATEASQGSRADTIHRGFWILGELAFRQGDIELAKQRLTASGQVSGSPVLGSFGPEMDLAAKLLDHGERDAVIAYLEECLKFWKSGQDRLKGWVVLIRNGETPNLGVSPR